jgi:hypothetical protein
MMMIVMLMVMMVMMRMMMEHEYKAGILWQGERKGVGRRKERGAGGLNVIEVL